MESLSAQEIYYRIRENVGIVAVITLVFILISVGITLFVPKQYRAESRIFLYQQVDPATDPYTAQRGSDIRVDTLIDLAYTDAFFNSFVAQDRRIRDTFPGDTDDRRKMYRRDVVLNPDGGGFVSVDTYHSSANVAVSMNQAIITVLTEQSKTLFGDELQINTVDSPDLYDGIGRPNILLNLIGGAIFGFAIGIVYALTRPVEIEYEELPDLEEQGIESV